MAEIEVRGGRVAQGPDGHGRAIAILEELSSADPSNARHRGTLAIMYQRTVFALLRGGEAERALELAAKQLAINQDLSSADPADAVARRNLAGALSTFADAQVKSGRLHAGLASWHTVAKMCAGLAANDPANVQARRDLWLAHRELGDALARSGDLRGAQEYCRLALVTAEELASADAPDVQSLDELAYTLKLSARIKRERGEVSAALDELHRAAGLSEKVSASRPTDADYRVELGNSYSDLGKAYAALARLGTPTPGDERRRWREAALWYRRSLSVLTEMRDRDMFANASRVKITEAERGIEICEKQ